MSEEWCRQQLENLQIEGNRITTLSEIRDHLARSTSLEAAITSNFLASPDIINCADESSGSEQSTLACDILSICLSYLDLDTPNFSALLEPSLKHQNWNVRLLALNELIRILQRRPDIQTFNENITIAVINCLEAPLTTVGAAAIEILSKILLVSYKDGPIKTNLLQFLDGPDVVRCRVYEIGVNLARTSAEKLDDVENILGRMVSELDSDDILLKLNILELLVTLAEQNHGLVYLENKGVFELVTKQVEEVNRSPFGTILVPGYMKFFGKIAYTQPQRIILGYPDMVHSLCDCLVSGDLTIMPTALDTLGNLAHSSQGKIILDTTYSERIREVWESIGQSFRNYPTDIKVRALNSLEVVFKTEGQANNEVCEITKKWYQLITSYTDFRFLLEFCKNPFPEIKVACLSLLKTLCSSYKWSIMALRESAGFVEYLLDRRTEFDKDSMFLKWEINGILANAHDMFDAHTLLQFKKYVDEGVLYVQGVVEVAVDGS